MGADNIVAAFLVHGSLVGPSAPPAGKPVD
jgi:hypothetical protein